MALTEAELETMKVARPHAGDIAIVSMHEKGFPNADLYIGVNCDDDLEGVVPDGFFTMKRGDTLEMAGIRASEKWPGVRVMVVEDESENYDEE